MVSWAFIILAIGQLAAAGPVSSVTSKSASGNNLGKDILGIVHEATEKHHSTAQTAHSTVQTHHPTTTTHHSTTHSTAKSGSQLTTKTITRTLTNSAEIEVHLTVSTTTNHDATPSAYSLWMPTYTSTIWKGKHMAMQVDPTYTAKVGVLTGAPLYTAVSKALMAACTTVPHAAPSNSHGSPQQPSEINSCAEVASINNIEYENDQDWMNDGKLDLYIDWVSYYDLKDLEGMVSAIASTLNVSSMNPNNQYTPEMSCQPPPTNTDPGWCTKFGPSTHSIATIPGLLQAEYTQDTKERHTWDKQQMAVRPHFETGKEGKFACADDALVMDGLAALGMIPGLEFMGWLAAPALAVSALCDTIEKSKDD